MALNTNDLASYGRGPGNLDKVGFSSEAVGEHAAFHGSYLDGRFKHQSFEFELSSLAAVSTDIGRNITGQVIAVILEIMTLVVAGGTSVKIGIGPTGSTNKYGLTADLLKNTKITTNVDLTTIAPVSAEDVQINLVTTAGNVLGDTAATAGKIRCTIVYTEAGAYANTP